MILSESNIMSALSILWLPVIPAFLTINAYKSLVNSLYAKTDAESLRSCSLYSQADCRSSFWGM